MRSPTSSYGFQHVDSNNMPSTEEYHKLQSRTLSTLPDYVARDIISIEPADSYANARLQREQRLRSLLRRYTNQIQYGCRNRNCTTRTCLSFRKRNTKGPVRPYSDVTARSIAASLVDEYFKAGKDPATGLCQNEPVVPWYRYPDEAQSRSKSGRASAKEQSVACKSRHISPRKTNNLLHLEGQVDTIKNKRAGQSHIEAGHAGDNALDETALTTAVTGDIRPPEEKALVLSPCPPSSVRTSQDHDQDQVLTNNDQSIEPPTPPKKDWASFVQCLWDTAALTLLSKPQTSVAQDKKLLLPTSERDSEVLLAPTEENDSELRYRKTLDRNGRLHGDGSIQPRAPNGAYRFLPLVPPNVDLLDGHSTMPFPSPPTLPSHFGTVFYGFTLRRLTWPTLTWLSTMWSQRSELPSPAFETFVRQSIFHCLSNPFRLHDSARSWVQEGNHDVHATVPIDSDDGPAYQAKTSQNLDSDPGRHSTLPRSKIVCLDVTRVLWYLGNIQFIDSGTKSMYSSLHSMLQQCYEIVQPKDLKKFQHTERLALRKFKSAGGGFRHPPLQPQSPNTVLSTAVAADIFAVTLLAALAPLFGGELHDAGFEPLVLGTVEFIRNRNHAYPPPTALKTASNGQQDLEELELWQLIISLIDHFEDWYLLRLTYSLVNCLSHHIAAEEIRKTKFPHQKPGKSIIDMMMDSICRGLPKLSSDGFCPEIGIRAAIGLGIKELVRSILLKEWDREPVIQRTSPVGGALELLAATYRRTSDFYIQHNLYPMSFIAQAFDSMEMPTNWLSFKPNGQNVHILQYSFLFDSATLVKYFRSINATVMRRSHENASVVSGYTRLFLADGSIPVYGAREVLEKIRPQMAKYFVLTVRRDNVLEDAINQIWRRHKQEVLQPLKVRLGKDEGEAGLDHGGVQQEFFKLVFAEAFQTEYGMFTVDSTTHMTWFQPSSVEQLYRFEALGILMSLAIYNAVTLPVTMPLAFYRKLLGLKVKKLEHIEDGWPVLAKGLQGLLSYEGDVAEHIARTYEFSYDFAGMKHTVDMLKYGHDDPWPVMGSRKGKEKAKSTSFELPVQLDLTPPSISPTPDPLPNLSRTSSLKGISTPVSMTSDDVEAPLVTNETRDQYVKDYIFWLTDKSIRPQYDAFTKGFFTCIDQGALSMFTPEALRDVVEGHRQIDLSDLQSTATYEDYEKDSEYITDFWDVIKSFSPEQHRKLLEFVTASDRVPVSGLSSIQFIVQKNGEDDERLPSSSTCYGRLLLPRYSTKRILEEKLTKALENSMGFGVL